MTARTAAHETVRRPNRKSGAERKAERRREAERRAARKRLLIVATVAVAFAGLAIFIRQGSPPSTSSTADVGAMRAVAETPFPSSDGTDVRLSQFRGAPLVLYFYEGQSCGACQTQLQEIQGAMTDLQAQGAQVLGVTMDPVDISASVASQLQLSYPIVEDVDHQLGSAMGTFEASGHMGAVDQHSVVVLSADGTVAWQNLAGTTMYVPTADIVAAVKAA